MDSGMIVVLVIVFVLVVGVNGFLLLYLRRGAGRPGESGWFGLWKKVARRARNPWESEDNDLKELSTLVEKLKDRDK